MNLQFESLHTHTKNSDGHQSHLEVLASAEKYGIGTLAFTDHDMLPSEDVLKELKAYAGPVKWLIGIELSLLTPPEVDDASPFHMLGLFIDPHNKNLLEYCQMLEEGRILRMRRVLEHLNALGFDVTEEDCFAASGTRFVGSPHMVKAVMSKPENKVIFDRMMKEVEAKGKDDPEIKKSYDYMIQSGEIQYPYRMFMKRSSFYPLPKAEFGSDILRLDEGVDLIRDAGGVAVLAHWFFEKKKLPFDLVRKLMTEKRIDGVETEVVNTMSNTPILKERDMLQEAARTHGQLETIGSDSHYDEDLKVFAKSTAATDSIGQTAEILKHHDANLEWTNFG